MADLVSGLKIVTQSIALAGSQVSVAVTVTNLSTSGQYIAIVAAQGIAILPWVKSGETLSPGQSATFTTSFTMPNTSTKVTVYKYHYVKEKEGWGFDETAYADISLVFTSDNLVELKQCQTDLVEARKTEILPTYSNISDLIRQVNITSLKPSERAKAWWNTNKAVWKVFAKPSIEPYEDWTPFKLWAEIEKVYNGSGPNYPKLQQTPISDGKYRVTTIANLQNIFENSFVGLIPYISDLHDCDDFARELMIHCLWYTLNSVLPVWGDSGWGYHAYNLAVCSDGLVEIEPQLSGHEGSVKDFFKVLPDIIGVPGGYWIPRLIRDW